VGFLHPVSGLETW